MTEHTPGPWALNPFNAQVDAFDTGSAEAICQILWPTTIRSESQTEANARLIAAAPELLEALQGLLTTMSVTDEEGLLEFAEPVAKARAAISKATSP